MLVGRFFFVLFFVPVISASSVANQSISCPNAIAGFFKARDVKEVRGRLRFSPANTEFFRKQREGVRQFLHHLNNRYFEMDHAVRRVLLARMMKSHVFLWGDPGGAKSRLARDILYVPRSQPDGSSRPDVFAIQLNQLMSDAPIRGFIDPQKFSELKERVKQGILAQNLVTWEHINNEGTVVHFSAALLDELDKGNPVALAALLDILNEKVAQYGPVSVSVRTDSIIATSNMRVEEFIQTFREQGMESTARALLDRFPFKVLLPNYVTDPQMRKLAIERYGVLSTRRAREALANNKFRFESSTAQISQITSDLPEVDWIWLGNIAMGSGRFSKDALYVTEEILHQMRSRFYTIRRKSEADAMEDGGFNGKLVYYPPTIFSMRNIMQFSRDTIATSVFLDLAALPESALPTETLVKLIEEGILIDRLSTWRLQDVILTGAPGDPVITMSPEGKGVTLTYGFQLEELLKDTFDQRQEGILKFIVEERDAFVAVYSERMASNQLKLEDVSEVLAQLLGKDALAGAEGIEKYLNLVAPKPQPKRRE